MLQPDQKYWWVFLCLGIALGLLASFLFPGPSELSKYLWITGLSLVIILVSLQWWNTGKPVRPHRSSGSATAGKNARPATKETTRTTSTPPRHSAGRATDRSEIRETLDLSEKKFALSQKKNGRESDNRPRPARKVQLTKVAGDKNRGPSDPIVGFELSPPAVGESYRIRTVRKTVVATSAVLEIGPDFVRTRNSYYERRILREAEGGS